MTASRRVAVFADGDVGFAIVEKLVAYAPDSVVALVTTEPVEAPCETRVWSDDITGWLRSKQPDVIILAWWPYLLKGPILDAAPIILNTHPSLLPWCRGKDPNFWAIIEQAPFGVTLHHVNADIDAGHIAFQAEIPVSWTDTGETLYAKALTAMVDLVEESLPAIVHGDIPCTPQSAGGSLHYRKQLDPASTIDLDAPTTAREVLNRLRARTFPPHPGAHFTDDGHTYQARISIEELPG